MAKVNKEALRKWKNGEIMNSTDYEQEREIIVTAINDNYDRMVKKYVVLNADGTTKSTQNLTTALNSINFKDSSDVIIVHDPTTSTLILKMNPVLFENDVALASHRMFEVMDHPDGSVTTVKLRDRAVTTEKLADGSVTTEKHDEDSQSYLTGGMIYNYNNFGGL